MRDVSYICIYYTIIYILSQPTLLVSDDLCVAVAVRLTADGEGSLSHCLSLSVSLSLSLSLSGSLFVSLSISLSFQTLGRGRPAIGDPMTVPASSRRRRRPPPRPHAGRACGESAGLESESQPARGSNLTPAARGRGPADSDSAATSEDRARRRPRTQRSQRPREPAPMARKTGPPSLRAGGAPRRAMLTAADTPPGPARPVPSCPGPPRFYDCKLTFSPRRARPGPVLSRPFGPRLPPRATSPPRRPIAQLAAQRRGRRIGCRTASESAARSGVGRCTAVRWRLHPTRMRAAAAIRVVIRVVIRVAA